MEKIPFSLPEIGEEEIDEVVDTLRSGWLTTGAKAARFEQEFSNTLGAIHSLAVNSATSGLHLSLCAANVSCGDEVLIPVNTFAATAEVVRYLGAHPRFVDIDFKTMNIDPAKIEEALDQDKEQKIKAIIPVHMAGLACDMEPILELGNAYDLKIIEDAAHALPTSYKGKNIGSLPSFSSVFSFYVTKPLCTGEGGMICTSSAEVANQIKTLRLHGINRDVWDRYTNPSSSWKYDVIATGFKYNFPDILASIGLHQLKKIHCFMKRREEIARFYDQELRNSGLVLPQHAPLGDLHSWHLYLIRLPEHMDRDDFIERLGLRGIGTSVHFIPLHLMTHYRDSYGHLAEDFPVALKSFSRLVSLPIYSKMTNSEVEKVAKTVIELIG